MVDSIEANVESASIRVNEGADELRMAERYQVPLAHSCLILLFDITFLFALFSVVPTCHDFLLILHFAEQSEKKENVLSGNWADCFNYSYPDHRNRRKELRPSFL